jgi:molybdopterin molybdotransferase
MVQPGHTSKITLLHEALGLIMGDAPALHAQERVPLVEALGRVLAEDVVARVDVPPWDNSAMDGFAVNSQDTLEAPVVLAVQQRIAAGNIGETLAAGSAARIFTGAPLPEGADSVVIQEDVTWRDNRLYLDKEAAAGSNVRARGQDISCGSVVLRRGKRLQPQDLGVLASIGLGDVPVLRRLRVGMFSSGDELAEPGSALKPGQIYNSNRYTLGGLLQTHGCDYHDFGIVADTREATIAMLQQAATQCDVLISTGGVSVGDEDHVKAAVESLGEIRLWKLAIKPGKPLAYGRVAGVPFFGLPGNPASAFVTFGLVVRPYLLAMQGADIPQYRARWVRAEFDWPDAGTRQEYLRGNLGTNDAGEQTAMVFDNQSSGILSSISRADCLVVMPVGATCRRGELVQVIDLRDWTHW